MFTIKCKHFCTIMNEWIVKKHSVSVGLLTILAALVWISSTYDCIPLLAILEESYYGNWNIIKSGHSQLLAQSSNLKRCMKKMYFCIYAIPTTDVDCSINRTNGSACHFIGNFSNIGTLFILIAEHKCATICKAHINTMTLASLMACLYYLSNWL